MKQMSFLKIVTSFAKMGFQDSRSDSCGTSTLQTTTVNMLRKIQKVFAEAERDLAPTNLPDQIIFVRMFNHVDLNMAGASGCASTTINKLPKFPWISCEVIGAILES